mgnify:CR=1 FL=1
MIKREDTGALSILGSWDDTHGYQFIVNWYEAGEYCYVYMLGGVDYGGGVTAHAEVPVEAVETLVSLAEQMNDVPTMAEWELYEAVGKLVKEYQK